MLNQVKAHQNHVPAVAAWTRYFEHHFEGMRVVASSATAGDASAVAVIDVLLDSYVRREGTLVKVCVCVRLHVYIYICVRVFTCVYIYMCVCVHVCTCTHACMGVHVRACTRMCLCYVRVGGWIALFCRANPL